MDEHRLNREVAALAEKYTVRRTPDGIIDLVRFSFPADWTPRTSTLRYVVADDYPASPPTVHIPAEMAYRGQQNIRRMQRSRFDGWKRWCVTFGWDPRRHSLVTVTRQMMDSLSNPSKKRIADVG